MAIDPEKKRARKLARKDRERRILEQEAEIDRHSMAAKAEKRAWKYDRTLIEQHADRVQQVQARNREMQDRLQHNAATKEEAIAQRDWFMAEAGKYKSLFEIKKRHYEELWELDSKIIAERGEMIEAGHLRVESLLAAINRYRPWPPSSAT